MKTGRKLKFTEASDEQVNFGSCDDPRKVLSIGSTYEVEDFEIHSWHTKVKLVGVDGMFNSVHFEEVLTTSKSL